MSGEALARAAEALAGTRYRLHGRDPATGLDCVGLLAASLAAIGRRAPLPNGYAMRALRLPDLDAVAAACGLLRTGRPLRPGDVLLARPGPCQHHLLVAGCGERFVHAHAGLRRVVIMPGPLAWPADHRWRLI